MPSGMASSAFKYSTLFDLKARSKYLDQGSSLLNEGLEYGVLCNLSRYNRIKVSR